MFTLYGILFELNFGSFVYSIRSVVARLHMLVFFHLSIDLFYIKRMNEMTAYEQENVQPIFRNVCVDTCVYPYFLFTLDRIFHRFLPLLHSAAGLLYLCVFAYVTRTPCISKNKTVKNMVLDCYASTAAACSNLDLKSTDHLTTSAMSEGE